MRLATWKVRSLLALRVGLEGVVASAAGTACIGRKDAPSAAEGGGSTPAAVADVLTHRGGVGRQGAQLVETTLTPANVSSGRFGLLGKLPVDGEVYAQPLFCQALAVGGRELDVVFVATVHNSVYAFDASEVVDAKPLWQVTLAPAMPMTDFPGEYNFAVEIGIVGTPVIDRAAGALYVVTASRSADAQGKKTYSHALHALDITSGRELFGGPQGLEARVAGDGAASAGGEVTFDSFIALQRTAMLLSAGTLYFGTAAHAYSPLYHGWLFAYDAATLRQKGALNTTSDSAQGGIWMSGGGPSVDEDGSVFVTSGNGLNADPNRDHQQSLLKFAAGAAPLAPSDWFTVSDWRARDQNDLDFGTTSATVIPGLHLLAAGDKLGNLYLVDSRKMGHVQANDAQLAAKVPGLGKGFGIYGAPVFYDGALGPRLFAWAAGDVPRAYRVEGQAPYLEPTDTGAEWTRGVGMPGGVMTLSAAGRAADTAIVWAAVTLSGSASGKQQPGVLVALDAGDLAKTLYRSDAQPSRDGLGLLGKFTPPTVARGRVFVATHSQAVAVYGLLP